MNKSTQFPSVRETFLSKIFGWIGGLFYRRRLMTAAELYLCIERARVLKRCRELERKCERLQKEKIACQQKLDASIIEGREMARRLVDEEKEVTREAEEKVKLLESEKAIHEIEIKLLTQIMEKYGYREELETAQLIAKKELITNPQQR